MNNLHSNLKKYVIPENSSINDAIKCISDNKNGIALVVIKGKNVSISNKRTYWYNLCTQAIREWDFLYCLKIVGCLQQGGKILLMGNGAADAQHIDTELVV